MSQESVENIKKLVKANNGYVAGCLYTWAILLHDEPAMKDTIIKDMKKLADLLQKDTGVGMIQDADE